MKSKYAIIASTILMAGCVGTVDYSKLNVNIPNIPVNNGNSENIKDARNLFASINDSLKDASKEDCIFLAKVYFGLADYVAKSKNITKTQQIAPPGLVSSVVEDYGWDVKKYPAFTALIKKDMEEFLKLDTPKEIDSTLREQMVATFKVYGEGCRRAASNKR